MSTDKPLTWTQLNNALREATTPAECKRMLTKEETGSNREAWKLRIFSRMNKLRRAAELAAL